MFFNFLNYSKTFFLINRNKVEPSSQDTGIESSDATSAYTVQCYDFEIPVDFGNSPPEFESVEADDDKTFPRLFKWLCQRKEACSEAASILTRTQPEHTKNLKYLVSQYEEQQQIHQETRDKFEESCKELGKFFSVFFISKLF